MAFARAACNPRWLPALVFAVGWLTPSRAVAEERTSSLSWVKLDGAESCITTQDLAQAVEKRLDRKVFVSASEADVSVEGHVEKSGGKWRAVITIREADGTLLGTRELDSAEKECSALDEPLALVVSILIDPDAELGAPPKPPEATPPAKPPPAPPPRVVVKRERVLVPVERPRPEPWRVEASLGGAVALGILPGTAPGVSTFFVVEPPHFVGLFVAGNYWLKRTVDAVGGAESDVSLAHAGLGLCPLSWNEGRVSYRSCGGVAFGSLQSKGRGFDTTQSDEKLFAAVLLPNRFLFRIAGPLAVSAGVTVLIPLVRTELTYRTSDGVSHSLYDPAPVGGAADVGLALSFP